MTRTTETTRTTQPAPTTLTPLQQRVLAATRTVVALLFICHGTMSFGAFGGVDGAGAAAPLGAWPAWYAGVIEVGAGALVLLGLFTRSAAVLCSGTMAYAYFTVHQPMALLPLQNMGEQAALFCWIFLLIAVLGPGTAALDGLRRTRRSRT
ncbi:DoxX family protein [Prauserella oleivorans]|uniref:DoxX family protein n=1 Tax=Prauserella oleivorans TaxID=1478153 RepID=A0ABW5W4K2_9PSEU